MKFEDCRAGLSIIHFRSAIRWKIITVNGEANARGCDPHILVELVNASDIGCLSVSGTIDATDLDQFNVLE